MHSLTWTQIQTAQPRPQARQWFTLTSLNNNQLVLHGGLTRIFDGPSLSDTWIMDLTSYSWRQYISMKDHPRDSHTASVCLNNNVIIIGGRTDDFKHHLESFNAVFHVRLEAKSLQLLAAKTICKYQDEINWDCLPKKLIFLLGFSKKEPTLFTQMKYSFREYEGQRWVLLLTVCFMLYMWVVRTLYYHMHME